MALKERLTEDMKSAMRAGDKERLATIRLALAAIKQREVDERTTLDDAQVLAVLEKMIKQRREAIPQFESGGRADLVAKETAEIAVLKRSEEHTSELQSRVDLVCRLLLEKKTVDVVNTRTRHEARTLPQPGNPSARGVD